MGVLFYTHRSFFCLQRLLISWLEPSWLFLRIFIWLLAQITLHSKHWPIALPHLRVSRIFQGYYRIIDLQIWLFTSFALWSHLFWRHPEVALIHISWLSIRLLREVGLPSSQRSWDSSIQGLQVPDPYPFLAFQWSPRHIKVQGISVGLILLGHVRHAVRVVAFGVVSF